MEFSFWLDFLPLNLWCTVRTFVRFYALDYVNACNALHSDIVIAIYHAHFYCSNSKLTLYAKFQRVLIFCSHFFRCIEKKSTQKESFFSFDKTICVGIACNKVQIIGILQHESMHKVIFCMPLICFNFGYQLTKQQHQHVQLNDSQTMLFYIQSNCKTFAGITFYVFIDNKPFQRDHSRL